MLTVAPALGQTRVGAQKAAPPPVPLVVGWHDEMNDPGLWHPLEVENQPDAYAAHKGALCLRLPHVPDGFPYAYQWSGVTRTVSADLGRYPVLMARVASLDTGSYAHLEVEERDASGKPTRAWRSPTLTRPGLTLLDLGKELDGSVRRLTVRLIVGGALTGAKCEYDWLRFVKRTDVAYLQEVPGLQAVTSTEPAGDAAVFRPAPVRPGNVALISAKNGFALTEGGPGKPDVSLLPAPRRVRFTIEEIAANVGTPQQQIDFFIHTGSLDAPLVTLADNAGFPDILNVYARPKTAGAMQGVLISLILAHPSVVPARAAFALNVWQPAMPGPCTVFKAAPSYVPFSQSPGLPAPAAKPK